MRTTKKPYLVRLYRRTYERTAPGVLLYKRELIGFYDWADGDPTDPQLVEWHTPGNLSRETGVDAHHLMDRVLDGWPESALRMPYGWGNVIQALKYGFMDNGHRWFIGDYAEYYRGKRSVRAARQDVMLKLAKGHFTPCGPPKDPAAPPRLPDALAAELSRFYSEVTGKPGSNSVVVSVLSGKRPYAPD